MTAFTGVDSQNLPDVMVSVQFILAIGDIFLFTKLKSFLTYILLYKSNKKASLGWLNFV
ncbi:hypothetical protein [Lactobacillus delbrueckii]|uniref:hypothetical protein n=1 Tax=Lactobacillus delbrueckii TaxID=1584 RepID=UPI0012FE064C|nr:hypothetical protein [Lactobacillus delbrueckii]